MGDVNDLHVPEFVGTRAPAVEALEGDCGPQRRQGALAARVQDAVDFEIDEVEQLLELLPAEWPFG